jgi:hypothetical protein
MKKKKENNIQKEKKLKERKENIMIQILLDSALVLLLVIHVIDLNVNYNMI